jgi:hypothetical protein
MKRILIPLILSLVCYSASAQVTITSGGEYVKQTYFGNNTTAAVTIATTSAVTFYQCVFYGTVNLVNDPNGGSTVTYQDCYFYGENPNVSGQGGACCLNSYKPSTLNIYSCEFSGYRQAVWVHGDPGEENRGSTITIWATAFYHQNCRESNGSNGWLATDTWGPNITFFNFQGSQSGSGSSIRILWNDIINTEGTDEPADQINIYECSNVYVGNNYIQGAVGVNETTMNGIVTDDYWSDTTPPSFPNQYLTTCYCDFESNILVAASMGLWAGHNNKFNGNMVINDGKWPNGTWHYTMYGVGRFDPSDYSPDPGWTNTNIVTNNSAAVKWSGGTNGYDFINEGTTTNWSGNTYGTDYNQSTAYSKYRQPGLTQNKITIGPNWTP